LTIAFQDQMLVADLGYLDPWQSFDIRPVLAAD
jgi:hypothetical protein